MGDTSKPWAPAEHYVETVFGPVGARFPRPLGARMHAYDWWGQPPD